MSDDPDCGAGSTAKIEFPCLYPIKIIGKAERNFREIVVAAVERHTGQLTADLVKVQPSRRNNYLSVTVTIAAAGEEQLRSIFLDLKKIESVKMVL